MTCPDRAELLARVVDTGGATPDPSLKGHLAVCSVCRGHVEALARVRDLVARPTLEENDAERIERIVSYVRSAPGSPGRAEWARPWSWIAGLALAGVISGVAILLVAPPRGDG